SARHSRQSVDPIPLNNLSPHSRHRSPAIGSMESRHSGQTGRSELDESGRPQRRQSEGHNKLTTLSNAVQTTFATGPRRRNNARRKTSPGGAGSRVRSPVLLKTTLLANTRTAPEVCTSPV